MDRFDRALAFSMAYPGDPNRTYATGEEYRALKSILAHPQEYPCPFCKQCPCEHWDGIGWTNPKFREAS